MAGSRSRRNSNDCAHELGLAPWRPSEGLGEIGGHRHRVGGGDGTIAHLDVEGPVGVGVALDRAHGADGSVKMPAPRPVQEEPCPISTTSPSIRCRASRPRWRPYKGKALLLVNVASRVWAHPAVRRAPEAPGHLRRQGVHRARLPVQPVPRAGARHRRRDRRVLLGQLRRHLPAVREDRGQRPGSSRHLRRAHGGQADPKVWPGTSSGISRSSSSHPRATIVERFRPGVEPEDAGLVASGRRGPARPARNGDGAMDSTRDRRRHVAPAGGRHHRPRGHLLHGPR